MRNETFHFVHLIPSFPSSRQLIPWLGFPPCETFLPSALSPTYSLAEIEEEPLKDQDGSCAAQNGEGLTSKKAKYGTRDSRAQEALQYALWRHRRGSLLQDAPL